MNASTATSTGREAVAGAVAGKGPACRGGVPTLSSHRSGKCSRISRGSASAAMTMSSAMPRFSVLVAVGGKRARMSGAVAHLDVLRPGPGLCGEVRVWRSARAQGGSMFAVRGVPHPRSRPSSAACSWQPAG
jgi:hypothetical protein